MGGFVADPSVRVRGGALPASRWAAAQAVTERRVRAISLVVMRPRTPGRLGVLHVTRWYRCTTPGATDRRERRLIQAASRSLERIASTFCLASPNSMSVFFL